MSALLYIVSGSLRPNMNGPNAAILLSFEECNSEYEELSGEEHSEMVRRWVLLYGELYDPARRRLSGARAISEAENLSDGSFVLVPCRNAAARGWGPVAVAYRCRSRRLPDLTAASQHVDLFISPEDLSWTLLYGHEVDVIGGPAFTRLDWSIPPSTERASKRSWSSG